ncbi:DUF305 domain-containing protein [Arthrobacter cheniae]|uniref:DUF305 domain-containing protein n=1 Tax=Arthrobacter cheniae TaxID=1258888 RepID=A0A3A5LZD0_9MICC|nr:DUF305 domain-containing protein [Arthrobacter cheniae]RJT76974.1 DUF305 domain-containing protein [Arthrobacter cheniae]
MFSVLSPARFKVLLAGLVVALVLGGVALFGAQRTVSAAVPDEASADAGFSRDMQVHHTQAVEMSMIAWDRSDDLDVKTIAYDMATAQQAQIGHMSTWLENWDLGQSSSLEPMAWMNGDMETDEDPSMTPDSGHGDGVDGHEGMSDTTDSATGAATGAAAGAGMPGLASEEDLARLRTLTGVEGDRLFLTLMIAHHRGGVMMAQAALGEASNDTVKDFAQKQVIAQQADIEAMEEMLTARQ